MQQLALTFGKSHLGHTYTAMPQQTLVRQTNSKYYDKLSANLHLPGKTLHFSTQMYIILFGRVRNEVKENRAVRAYKIVYITV